MPSRVDLSRLPRTDEHFVGRQNELALLDDAWTTGKNVFSIVAWGGVGKTALVQHWLGRLAERHYDGARVYAWSFYSQGTDVGRLASADPFVDEALRRFGDPDPTAGSARDRGLRLADLLRTERSLLVLDGVEPLQHPPDSVLAGRVKDPALAVLLKSLAAENDGLCVVTTREKVDDLVPFTSTTSPRLDLEHLKPEDGVELLRRLEVDGSEKDLLATSKEMGGHALALQLLGNLLRRMYGGDVRRRHDAGFGEADERQGGHAFRVMAAYEKWFGEGPELSVLRLMGLFDRPASGSAVAALRAPPSIDGLTDRLADLSDRDWTWTLSKLRENGLLAASAPSDPGALDAHPLVRAYFADVLERRRPDAWRAGHLRLYEHLCAAAPDQPDTLEEMTPLFQAVVHGCRAGRQREAFEEVYWRRIQRGQEFFSSKKLGAMGSLLTALSGFFDRPWDRPSEALEASDQAFVLNEAGLYLRALGRLTEAIQPMRAGLEIRRSQEKWKNAAIIGSNLSELQLTVGEVEPAVASAEESVRLADRSGDAFQRMSKRTTLADALHQAGRREEAAVAFREAEEMQAEMQPQYPRLYSLQGYQYCDLLLGRLPSGMDSFAGSAGVPPALRPEGTSVEGWREVIERTDHALDIVLKGLRNLLDVGLNHLTLGRAHFALALAVRSVPSLRDSGGQEEEELGRAAGYLDRAVELLRQSGTEHHLPRGLLARAVLRRVQSDTRAALADLDEAEEIAQRGWMRLHECDVHLERARLEIVLGRPDEARERLERARRLVEETGYHRRDEELKELDVLLQAAETASATSRREALEKPAKQRTKSQEAVDGRRRGGRPRRRGRPPSLFAPKSSRIARWLLTHPGDIQREIARQTDMDEGFTSRIVSRLESEGLVVRSSSGVVTVPRPEVLLEKWRDQYDFSMHRILKGHIASRSGEELLRRLAESLDQHGAGYAATGLGAAWLLDRFANFRIVSFYLDAAPTEELFQAIAFRPEERGANTWFAVPADEGVFHGADPIEGVRCVHPVQIYLDLKGHPERAAEAAEHLRTEWGIP